MYQSEMETVYEGWLKKSQTEKKLFRPKTGTQKSSQKWFVLKQSGDIPGQYILDYYTDSTCKKQKGRVDLDQCKKIDRKIDSIKPDEYLFSIETTKRTYNLLAQSKMELNKWIECLCTVCGFKPNQPDTQLLLSDHKNGKPNELIIISYSNPNLSIDNASFSTSSSPTNKNLTTNHQFNHLNNNQITNQPKDKINLSRKWTNCSSTLNRTVNKLTNTTNCSFTSATLPSKKSTISSGYIPISECHTGKSTLFENSTRNDKKSVCSSNQLSKISSPIQNYDEDKSVKFQQQNENSKIHQQDSNKENKFNFKLNKSLLDSSLNSTQDLLLDINSRSSNLSNDDVNCDDVNYDVPRQIKMYKKSRIKDLLDIVPSPPKEILYANAKSLPRNKTMNYNDQSNGSSNNSNNLVNNYLNVNENLERQGSIKESSTREYYNNVVEYLNTHHPPPRPPKPIKIINKNRSPTDRNSIAIDNLNQNDLNEFDPLNSVPKAPSILATSLDLMYSIPKTQVELELEKQQSKSPQTNSLDTIVPITHKFNNDKNELHSYTNASSDVLNRSNNSQQVIYDYEKPTLPCSNNLNDNNLDQFKIPKFKLNDDKFEPMTPSLIVTSTPLFPDQTERHFNFNDQDDKTYDKPQVNRDLKPKKSDTSIESFLLYTNKSPNSHSDTLINRTSLNASFDCKPSSSNSNAPRIPSRGRNFGNRAVISLENESLNEDVNKLKRVDSIKKQAMNLNEIQYLDLDLDANCDSISLNSTINEISINSNFKDVDKEFANTSCYLNNNSQSNHLNNSFNVQPSLNYSHFNFSNRNDTLNQFNSLNSSFLNNTSTIYKTVDFDLTKAFKKLKDDISRKSEY